MDINIENIIRQTLNKIAISVMFILWVLIVHFITQYTDLFEPSRNV